MFDSGWWLYYNIDMESQNIEWLAIKKFNY